MPNSKAKSAALLRAQAEAAAISSDLAMRGEDLPKEVLNQVLHELHVHQIELEMQNEELRRNRDELELKRDELALSRQRYFELYDLAPVGYCTLDASGKITEANLCLAQLLGGNCTDLLNRPLTSLIIGVDQDIYYRHRLSVENDGHTETCEVRLTRPDGSSLWVSISSVLQHINGEARSRVVIADRSHQKEIEAELSAAKVRAEAASVAKTQFLANMSHELRTPLNGIILSVDILVGGELNPEQRELSLMLQKSGHNLIAVINDILDFSKIEAGMMELESIAFYPEALLSEVHELMQLGARQKELQFIIVPPSPPSLPCLGDPGRLRQILLNLVGNAIKFTPRGEVRLSLEIRAGPSPSQPQILRFSVRDTGIGMSETLLPHLGEPFTQADGSTSRRFGGTGLGISICQRLLHQMDSHLEVRSEFGSGTEFSFDLTPFAADIPEPAAPILVQNLQWRLKRILIVDDNIVNQMLLKALLSKFATYIDLADDGSAALELFSQYHYDCVLMDCEMPVMDGFEATQAIRDKERRYALRPTPIIAQTGHALDEIRTRCFAVGMNDFITKPLNRERLLEVMQRLCPST